jgi:hypothetical protein
LPYSDPEINDHRFDTNWGRIFVIISSRTTVKEYEKGSYHLFQQLIIKVVNAAILMNEEKLCVAGDLLRHLLAKCSNAAILFSLSVKLGLPQRYRCTFILRHETIAFCSASS